MNLISLATTKISLRKSKMLDVSCSPVLGYVSINCPRQVANSVKAAALLNTQPF